MNNQIPFLNTKLTKIQAHHSLADDTENSKYRSRQTTVIRVNITEMRFGTNEVCS